MEPLSNYPPLIVIVGQTGSGKSALAMKLAQAFEGEIIAADSRTVYTGMDIGTAKPSVADQALVPHHLIDIVSPAESFNLADFQRLAKEAITDITARGRLPILVGGTGLYVDSLLYNFGLRPAADPVRREALQKMSVDELRHEVMRLGALMPANDRNPRHLIRAIESVHSPIPQQDPLRPNTLVIGLSIEKEELEHRLAQRIDTMLDAGLVDEVQRLTDEYGMDTQALQAPSYRKFSRYLAGELSFEDAKELFVRAHNQYAKRQKTWFKRSKDIIWISKPEESVVLVTTFLNNMLYPERTSLLQ